MLSELLSRVSRAFAATAIFAAIAGAQAVPPAAVTPAFDVASIRVNTSPEIRWRMEQTVDGITATGVTLDWAMHEAYLENAAQQWAPGPGWLETTRFNIEARFDPVRYPHPSQEDRQAMLQGLLADRFHLVIHHEQREYDLLELRRTKKDLKLVRSKPDEVHHSSLDGHAMCSISRSGWGSLKMQGCTIEDLTSVLNSAADGELGRVIVDRTGLTDRYSLELRWSRMPLDATPTEGSTAPDLRTALREQLGLQLTATRGPLDTIVIDRVEMPAQN